MMRFAGTLVLLGVALAGASNLAGETMPDTNPPEPGAAVVLADLVRLYPRARVENALNPSAPERNSSGEVSLPGIFLHPRNEGEATLEYPPINVEPLAPNQRLVLVVALGIRDGAKFGARDVPRCDGVRFSVDVNGELRLTEDVRDGGWKWRLVDLSDRGGGSVAVTLATHRIETSAYDWAVFGIPLLLRLESPVSEPEQLQNLEPFDPDAGSIEVAGRTYLFPASLELRSPYPSRALPEEGKPVSLLVPVRNAGLGAYRQTEGARVAVDVLWSRSGSSRYLGSMAVPDLPPGAESLLSWGNFVAESPGTFQVAVEGVGDVFAGRSATGEFRAVSWMAQPSVSIGNEYARIQFLAQQDQVVFAALEVRGDSAAQWASVGRAFPLASVAVARRGSDLIRRQDVTFPTAKVTSMPNRYLRLSQRLDWEDVKGSVDMSLAFESQPGLFRFDLQADFEQPVDLYCLAGPRLVVGEGSFGSDHDVVLFPGLEYLAPEDHSSSTRDADPPQNLRRVPHPRKVTIPLMSIQEGDLLAALFWEAGTAWAQGGRHLSAYLDVPPQTTGVEYSQMRLFVPSVPDWVPEHELEARAPFPLEAKSPAKVFGWIYLDHRARRGRPSIADRDLDGAFGLAPLRKYVDTYQLPKPMASRLSWDEERALCRRAWFDTVWVPEARGWRHARGENWHPFPAPGYMLLLLLDAYQTDDPDVRDRVFNRVEDAKVQAVTDHGPGIFFSGTHCHVLAGEAPFLLGNLFESIDAWVKEGEGYLASQTGNGGWGWRPKTSRPNTRDLGEPGEQQSGTVASIAYRLLKLARVTGDARFRDAGLRGLARMEEFRIPRGAQGWEVPLHCPDILASGYAVRANVEAYKLTGEARYLDQARYWAWSGIPFVYLWNEPDIPSMRYNTIPVFGATHYVGSWFGVPVVWCGLLYAYGLQELAPLDPSFPWKTVAEGITRSAEWQQYEDDHPSAGCYPDSYDLMQNRRNPVDINPEGILVNAFALQGLDPGIVTHVVPFRGLETRLSGLMYELESNPPLTILPRLPAGAAGYFYLAPVKNFESITFGGAPLIGYSSLDSVPQGYRFDPERKRLAVKVAVQRGIASRLIIR